MDVSFTRESTSAMRRAEDVIQGLLCVHGAFTSL